jgi:ATP-dependent Clp protease ATP-binding subunit ClpB
MTTQAKEYIASVGFDPDYGARPLKRALYEIVEDRLAELILEDKIQDGSTVEFDFENNNITVKIS